MGALKEAAKEQGIEVTQGRSFSDILRSQWARIEAVMPKHMSGERLFQLAVSTYNHDPKLAQCDTVSLMSCIMKCSALGLEPSSVDGLGRAYILPYWNKKTQTHQATFILGYKGMIDLARRSGDILDISARTVHEGDEFSYQFGLHEDLYHVPGPGDRTPETMTHAYMVCHMKDGGHYIDVMTKDEIEAIRIRSKAKDSGPWVTDYLAMARKTVVRRAFPYLPVSIEAQMGATADETAGGYESELATVMEVEPVSVESVTEKTAEEPTEGEKPKQAACKSCGNKVDIAEDATVDDLNQIGCCDKPDYEIL